MTKHSVHDNQPLLMQVAETLLEVKVEGRISPCDWLYYEAGKDEVCTTTLQVSSLNLRMYIVLMLLV